MAEQLLIVGKIHAVINIQEFIELLGKEVEDSLKDLIKHVVGLYAGPDRDIEMDEEVVKQS